MAAGDPPSPPHSRERSEADDAPVPITFTDELDLHTFQPRDIPTLLDIYLLHARTQRWPTVRIIHGKGTGTLRTLVHKHLSASPHVASYHLCDETSGSWGATRAMLR